MTGAATAVAVPTPDEGDLLNKSNGSRFKISNGIVWHVPHDADPDAAKAVTTEFRVVARARDSHGCGWSYFTEWTDGGGQHHECRLSWKDFQGDGKTVRETLADGGVTIFDRKLVLQYLHDSDRGALPLARLVSKLGWHGAVYLTPNGPIGDSVGERVIFDGNKAALPAWTASGTHVEWSENVANLAAGNSRLVFAVSVAFAGPMLHLMDLSTVLFQFRGKSSSGKTTLARLAASVFGDAWQSVRTWRTTANGLEGVAAAHHDGLLVLDEIGQATPHDLKQAAYLLGNGQGKSRASKDGAARAVAAWNLTVISTGEKSMPDVLREAGIEVCAGQEVRFIDIDADAGAGFGAFEDLHRHPDGAAFAHALDESMRRYHGSTGAAWVEFLVKNREKIAVAAREAVAGFLKSAVPGGASGQVTRVARWFGGVAAAGEIASKDNFTGWQKGEATAAAGKLFRSWLETFGAGDREDHRVLENARNIFQTHELQFEDPNGGGPRGISGVDRLGYRGSLSDGTPVFFVFPEVFKARFCNGMTEKAAVKVYRNAGWLIPDSDGHAKRKRSGAPAGENARMYTFHRDKAVGDGVETSGDGDAVEGDSP